MTSAKADEAKVTIMTIHAAKGLEFDTVFLVGWEEGVFPSQRALDEGGLASLEEERRLAYVAITRARRRRPSSTPPTAASTANGPSIPSRFVAELPEEHIESETTMTGGESLWRAQLVERADPFADVARGTGSGPGWQRARPRLATGGDFTSRTFTANRRAWSRPGARGQLRQQGPRRPVARAARVPPEVRLRHDRRDRGQQARDRLRAGRAEAALLRLAVERPRPRGARDHRAHHSSPTYAGTPPAPARRPPCRSGPFVAGKAAANMLR
jgi:hypothetical protein